MTFIVSPRVVSVIAFVKAKNEKNKTTKDKKNNFFLMDMFVVVLVQMFFIMEIICHVVSFHFSLHPLHIFVMPKIKIEI